MWFQNAMQWLDTFFNKPLPIVGVSLIAILSFVWFIFKKTSFGKKAINKSIELQQKCQQEVVDIKNHTENKVNELKKEYENKIEAIKEFYETCLAQKQAKEDELEKIINVICNNVHNIKIAEAYNEYKKLSDSYTTIMTVKINEVKNKVGSEYENRIKALEEMIYGKETKDGSSKEE